MYQYQFLSTLSLRRATVNGGGLLSCFINFYPRSPCGERLKPPVKTHRQENFYPRSPCGERLMFARVLAHHAHFYPRSPCGERLIGPLIFNVQPHFYPRSPCGERRESRQPYAHPTTDFYPRSPCGERPAQTARNTSIAGHFYPRSPCGERPSKLAKTSRTENISIHALLAESDVYWYISSAFSRFLSTLSLRRATNQLTGPT